METCMYFLLSFRELSLACLTPSLGRSEGWGVDNPRTDSANEGGNWRYQFPHPSGDLTEEWSHHWEIPSGIEPQSPTVFTCIVSYFVLISLHSLSSFTIPSGASRISSLINCCTQVIISKVCLGGILNLSYWFYWVTFKNAQYKYKVLNLKQTFILD